MTEQIRYYGTLSIPFTPILYRKRQMRCGTTAEGSTEADI